MRSGSTRGNQERPKLIDMLGSTAKEFGATLGLLEGDSPPELGTAAYQRVRVSKLMDEDCISMRNEPIDPLETVDGMQFEAGVADALQSELKLPNKEHIRPSASRNYLDEMD